MTKETESGPALSLEEIDDLLSGRDLSYGTRKILEDKRKFLLED